jgi:flavin reductase (DIM6/NTAB) family NADH-FMN oxidoreductase RutF
VAVATIRLPDGAPHGLTVNSFTSVSCSPPLVLVCIDHRCQLLTHFRQSQYFGINVLAESQRNLSIRFSQRHEDRFDSIAWQPGALGVPLLEGALAQIECSLFQTHEAGDHTIFIGEVYRAIYNDGEPLIYYNSRYRKLEKSQTGMPELTPLPG